MQFKSPIWLSKSGLIWQVVLLHRFRKSGSLWLLWNELASEMISRFACKLCMPRLIQRRASKTALFRRIASFRGRLSIEEHRSIEADKLSYGLKVGKLSVALSRGMWNAPETGKPFVAKWYNLWGMSKLTKCLKRSVNVIKNQFLIKIFLCKSKNFLTHQVLQQGCLISCRFREHLIEPRSIDNPFLN